MGKWPVCCTSTGQKGPKKLDLEWIGLVIAEFGVRKILGAPIMPMGTPIRPRWANYHGVAHLRAKAVSMNLIWSESAQWLLSSRAARFQGPLLCPCAHPCGVNKLPWCCTSTGQDGFQWNWFGENPPVVTELRHPQSLERTDGGHSIVPIFSFRKGVGQWKFVPEFSDNWWILWFEIRQFYWSRRDHFLYAPSRWETTSQCNVVSHWLGAYRKLSLLKFYFRSLLSLCHPRIVKS